MEIIDWTFGYRASHYMRTLSLHIIFMCILYKIYISVLAAVNENFCHVGGEILILRVKLPNINSSNFLPSSIITNLIVNYIKIKNITCSSRPVLNFIIIYLLVFLAHLK